MKKLNLNLNKNQQLIMKKNIDDFKDLELAAQLVMVNVKHQFTPEELAKESEMMAQAVTDKQAEEANKKAAMGTFKNKIDTLDAEVKLRAGHVSNGFTYRDKSTDMYRDYTTSKRLYFDKSNGDLLKEEPFHASDFQKKLDFDKADADQQQQIDENNAVGTYAESGAAESFNPIDKVIDDKKSGKGKKKEKPTPAYNLPDDYDGHAKASNLHYDKNGNLTDLPK